MSNKSTKPQMFLPITNRDPIKRYAQRKFSGVVVTQKPINRNSKCPCGSGLKYRKCCMMRVNRGEGLKNND